MFDPQSNPCEYPTSPEAARSLIGRLSSSFLIAMGLMVLLLTGLVVGHLSLKPFYESHHFELPASTMLAFHWSLPITAFLAVVLLAVKETLPFVESRKRLANVATAIITLGVGLLVGMAMCVPLNDIFMTLR